MTKPVRYERDDLIDLVLVRHLRGYLPSEIALSLGVDQDRIMEILSSPVVKARAEDMRGQVLTHLGDLRFRFRELAPSAIERIAQLGGLDNDSNKSMDDSIQLRAALAVLDRAGYPATAKVETEQKQSLVIFLNEKEEETYKDPERQRLEEELKQKLNEGNPSQPETDTVRDE